MNMFKTPTAKTPEEYIGSLEEPRKSEIKTLHDLVKKTTPGLLDYIPQGLNGIGYGEFHYKSRSGREGDWPLIAIASQKNYISVYICAIKGDKYLAESRKSDFPKANIGKSCIRFTKVDKIDLEKLGKVFKEAEKLGGFFSA